MLLFLLQVRQQVRRVPLFRRNIDGHTLLQKNHNTLAFIFIRVLLHDEWNGRVIPPLTLCVYNYFVTYYRIEVTICINDNKSAIILLMFACLPPCMIAALPYSYDIIKYFLTHTSNS